MKHKWFVIFGVVGLICVYVFQNQLFYNPLADYHFNPQNPTEPNVDVLKLFLSKSFRYILNDGLALMVIWGLFGKKKYMKFAMIVFMFGFLVLLPSYVISVSYFFFETQVFQNHLHRLVLNPVLMMLLIPAFYYQKSLKNGKRGLRNDD